MQKRARSKHITNAVVIKLAELDSPMRKSYWNSWHCGSVIQQDGEKLGGRYCNNRWCLTCNRIRTAKLINGYSDQIRHFQNPMFVTLTAPTVDKDSLPDELKRRQKAFRRIADNMRKRYKIPIVGIRKVEITYNAKTNRFHPHYHIILDGQITANTLVSLWLKQFPNADRRAQDIRPADKDSLNEIFKYVTKLVAKGKKQLQAIDWIYQCLKGKRLIQPYGGIKRISEDIDTEQIKNCDWKPKQKTVYTWSSKQADWIKPTGETLTGYIMDEKTREMCEKILKGNIEITAPEDISEDCNDLVLTNWQRSQMSTHPEEIKLFTQMMERENPKPVKPKPPDKVKQLSIQF